MAKRQLLISSVVGLLILIFPLLIVAFTSNDNEIKDIERSSNLHKFQEELWIKFKHFERKMESEVTKLKTKVELLEAKVLEQAELLKECNTCSPTSNMFDNDMPVDHVKNVRPLAKTTLQPKTCLEALTSDPSLESGMYWIDPDGQGRGDNPIYVYCNMTSGSSSILHDSENSTDVDHCFDPGCYSRQIKYNATLRQITMLAELSNECHQSIQINCFDAALEFNGIAYAWWNDRNGDERYFWSGTNNNLSAHYHSCQCGLEGSCVDKSLLCNCDSDLAMELSDNGVITDKDLLPITKLNFGRTIAPTSMSSYKIGRLECSGKVVLNGMPTSCQDLWRVGYILSGIYSIKGSSSRVETVYCDFNKLPGDEGLQTWIGYDDVKSEPVYFNVGRNTSFSTSGKAMPFEQENLNVGNAFDLSSGTFVAPCNGTYFFAFTSFADNSYDSFYFSLNLNDVQITNCYNPVRTLYYCTVLYTVNLNSGDQVQMILQRGSTNNAIFTGALLAENVF
ncbi:contactin-associated protein-like 3 [Daphnia magna]|uniref:contactin-associated protein-like 3 n=1 Tax=Daphnia magna TaxID=35525 RepID=UPI001E1BB3B1|nr:contactin-associated protein-like 3 [Daphnia magna]